MKKKHGWIIQEPVDGFVDQDGDGFTEYIQLALIFSTRATARKNSHDVGHPDEVVRKVELTKNGKVKKIIGRG